VQGFDASKYLGDKGLRTLDRLTKLMVVAARLGLIDAGIKKDGEFVHSSPLRAGIVSSNAYGSLEAIVELDRVAKLEDARYINPAKFPNTVANSASGYVSIWESLQALNVAVSDGNCGGLDAFACADIYLDSDRADVLAVGGAEAMSEALFLAFEKFGALSDKTRLSEGAAFAIVESEAHAKARGARGLARIAGFGTAFVPPEDESTLVHASGEALTRAVRDALADAKVTPEEVDVVASSMLGVRIFDRAELAALSEIFPKDTCITAPKLVLGETLGAGGSMAAATAIAWLNGVTPAPVVQGKPKAETRVALVTAMGFYGNASALVLKRYES
jgi:3-oxoacyl-(acyl-carrier-protein) synthase